MTSIIDEPATEQPAFSVLVKGFAWATLSVGILSGWFVVTRLGLSHHLGIWDVVALRFGEWAVLLTPTLLLGRSKLPLRAWLQGIPLAVLWGAPFILLASARPRACRERCEHRRADCHENDDGTHRAHFSASEDLKEWFSIRTKTGYTRSSRPITRRSSSRSSAFMCTNSIPFPPGETLRTTAVD